MKNSKRNVKLEKYRGYQTGYKSGPYRGGAPERRHNHSDAELGHAFEEGFFTGEEDAREGKPNNNPHT